MQTLDPSHPYLKNLHQELERRTRYCEVWKIDSIPTEVLYAEIGRRRNQQREYTRSCECGECQKCKTRLWMANYRKHKAEGKVRSRKKKTPGS